MNATAAAGAPGAGRTAATRFIDPAVLTRIGNLDLVARAVVDGFISGLHRTRHLGVSTDFAEHRAYVPGDDVRRIDWQVYGRTDRLYVRNYEAETNADVTVVLDVSGSMGFASADVSKHAYGCFIAATLAEVASRQRDRIGLLSVDSDVVDAVPPSVRHRDAVLRTLDRTRASGPGDIVAALSRVAERVRRRGIIVVISDFYAAPEAVGGALGELSARGHDVVAMHVLDPAERTLELDRPRVFEDIETGERMQVDGAVVERYGVLVREHVEAVRRESAMRRADHVEVVTDRPLDEMLFRYLSQRAAMVRTR